MRSIIKYIIIILSVFSLYAYSYQDFDENEIKAAMIHKMFFYVEWPSNDYFKNGELVLKIVGYDEVAKILYKKVNNTIVNGLRVKVIISNPNDSFDDANVVYIANLNRNQAQRVMNSISNSPILVIANELKTYNLNFHIILFTVENKVKFSVNLEAARSSQLYISSKLVQLARKYGDS